jgi:hypothetical protein
LLFGEGFGFLEGRPLRFGITPVLGISFFGGLPLRLASMGVVSEITTSFGFSVTDLILFTCTTNLLLPLTFALTAQRRKGTILVLDVQAKIRRIPARIISDNEAQVEITTVPRYLLGIEESVGFVIEPIKKEPTDSEEELGEEMEDDEPVLKLDDFPEADEDSEKENVATNQHTKQKTNQQTQYYPLCFAYFISSEEGERTNEIL